MHSAAHSRGRLLRKRLFFASTQERALRLVLAAYVMLVLGASGCALSNLTPQTKFGDAAFALNDAARWNNADVALRNVAPAYRKRFASRHRFWGSKLSIAEYDLVRTTLDPGKESGTSEVVMSFYDLGGMNVRSATISQRWQADHGRFELVDEKVRAGDASVFADDEPETAGEQASSGAEAGRAEGAAGTTAPVAARDAAVHR